MDDRASIGPRLDPRRRDEWTGINFLLDEMERLHAKGLVVDDAYQTIVREYAARRFEIERDVRFTQSMARARGTAIGSPKEAIEWAARARELQPDRPEPWILGVDLLRKAGRHDEADQLAKVAAEKFPDQFRPKPATRPVASATRFPSSRVEDYLKDRAELTNRPMIDAPAPISKISWANVAGEFLEEHWQKLISGLAVLLIVVSSTVGASLVLGPLLWSPVGKGVLALGFTTLCAGFGLGLARWGAERAGQVMLATSLFVIPINFMLLGELRLLTNPSMVEIALVAGDAALLLALARGVVGALGFSSAGMFTAAYFGLACFNAGASPGMSFDAGLAVFLGPCVVFLGGVSWLNRRVGVKEESSRADPGYLGFGLLAFAFLAGVLRTGGLVLHLVPALYAVPAMLASIAAVSTARAIGPIEKDRRLILLFQQGGLTLSALAFALALARPPGPSALFSGNTLAVALLGLALYATSLRATRLPSYLYCGFAALFVAYFGAFYFAADLMRTVEEAARKAMGYDRKLPMPFKSINGLVFNLALAWLAKFFAGRWSDDRLARHCHYIGVPLSIAACVFSGFEPKAAVLCLSGYAILYTLGTWFFAQPWLIYLACLATAGSAFFGSELAGWTTLGVRSLMASSLGLIFLAIRALPGLKRAGEPYRIPWLRSARVLAACSMVAATLGSVQDGRIGSLATVAFLLTAALALLNGLEEPRGSIHLLAIAGLLGSWLGAYHLWVSPGPITAIDHGLAIAVFSAVLLLAGEGLRARFGHEGSAGAYLESLEIAVPMLVLAAFGLAGFARVDSVAVARTVLVGSSSLLWLTRFRRESILVYCGLAGLATWAACLCGLVVTGGWGSGRLESWLGLTLAGCSMAYWGVGHWASRRDDSFYSLPCVLMAGALAIGASVLAVEGRALSVEFYRVGVAAMLVGATSLGLVAASRRWPISVALATGSVVGASYLALLSQGPSDPKMVWVLGMLAAIEVIACRVVGWLIRRGSSDPESSMARPLDFAAFALLVVSIPFGCQSTPTLLVISVGSLLMIGSFPSSAWLFGTSLAIGTAAYRGWLWRYSGDALIPYFVLGAYTWWGLAVVARRSGPGLLRRLGLADLGLHDPLVKLAILLALLSALIRIGVIGLAYGEGWAALPWLPWVLSIFCLLMLRFDPERGWVHLAVGLSGLGYAATLAPWVQPEGWGFTASMTLACSWWLAGVVVKRFEGPIGRRLGIEGGLDSEILRNWSVGVFGLAAIALTLMVTTATFVMNAGRIGHWPDVLLAIGLAGLYVGLAGRRFGTDAVWIGLEVVALLAVWWLAAPGSSFSMGLGMDRHAYLALNTASYALVVAWLGIWSSRRSLGGVVDPSDLPERSDRSPLIDWTSWLVFGLGWIVVYFSIWTTGRVALGSFLLATAATGTLAIGWKRVESAIEGGILWCLSWPMALVLVAREMGYVAANDRGSAIMAESVAIGLALGVFSLWWASGWVRRLGEGKGGEPSRTGRVALAMEWVAIAFSVPSALVAMPFGEGTAWVASGLLLAMTTFYAMVAWRREVEWPVYVAQGLMLACFFHARLFLFTPSETDGVILSILAYLDLGLAELMARLRWRSFARPTLRFALALPLVPILLGISEVGWARLNLFLLLATAGFYALGAVRLRSKIPGYASAIFFNGFLWLVWYRQGWELAESPQFYLIPVGFSTILLGEVNREELGRSAVNGLRNLGLVVIYASLAIPIWQSQSFGAWLVLLMLSLAGIFAGIGLRIQSFLWLGLACFVMDVTYQLCRVGIDHVLARWAVMLTLGVVLMLFVALNEKKRIVATMRNYYTQARSWD